MNWLRRHREALIIIASWLTVGSLCAWVLAQALAGNL